MQQNSSAPLSKDAATVAAARLLFDNFARLGAAAVGFTALAYYFGARALEAEYSAMGVGWYAHTLPFDRKVWAGLFAALPLLGQFAMLLPSIARDDGPSQRSLRKAALSFFSFGVLFAILPSFWPEAHAFRVMAAICWLLSVGFTLAEVVVRIRDKDMGWSSYTVYLAYSWVFIASLQVPHQWGTANGGIRAEVGYEAAPEVTLEATPGKVWRLVDANPEMALLVRSAGTSASMEFRMVKLDGVESFVSTRRAAPAHLKPATKAASAASR